MRRRSLYDILGVVPAATATEIKAAFRKHARDHHPDTAKSDGAEDRFKEISRAYSILGNEAERRRYDRGDIDETGAAAATRRKDQHSPFSKGGPDRAKPRASIRIAGADVRYRLSVGVLEANKGIRKAITTTSGKHLSIAIPAGTKDGQVLRLKEQGMPGHGGGRNGDALIEINIDHRDRFRIEGADVHLDLPVSLKEAVLGAAVEVPGIDTPLRMTVPAGSNSGDVVRLGGMGLEKPDDGRGDQIVHLIVTLPEKPDAALTAFVRDWSPQNPFAARARSTRNGSG